MNHHSMESYNFQFSTEVLFEKYYISVVNSVGSILVNYIMEHDRCNISQHA